MAHRLFASIQSSLSRVQQCVVNFLIFPFQFFLSRSSRVLFSSFGRSEIRVTRQITGYDITPRFRPRLLIDRYEPCPLFHHELNYILSSISLPSQQSSFLLRQQLGDQLMASREEMTHKTAVEPWADATVTNPIQKVGDQEKVRN